MWDVCGALLPMLVGLCITIYQAKEYRSFVGQHNFIEIMNVAWDFQIDFAKQLTAILADQHRLRTLFSRKLRIPTHL